jgi:hypothetical protein
VTIAFLAFRRGFLRVLGSLVQAALDRGHRVVLLWDPGQAKPGEGVSAADLGVWPGAEPHPFPLGAPLAPVVRRLGIAAVVAPSLDTYLRAARIEGEVDAVRQAGARLYSVDYAFETVTADPASYRSADMTFYTSEYQRALHWRLMAEGFSRLGPGVDPEARSAVAGSTMMDQLAVVDRAAVRKRFGLGADQPVVVLMSLKMAVPDPWRRLVWGGSPRLWRAARAALGGHAAWVPEILSGHGYRELVLALRDLCRREGAALVVKSREKNADPAFLRRLADVFVYDETVYPYTSMELMAVASLCVHFQSGAVLEAAFAGVPSLSVEVSQSHLAGYASFDEVYGGRPGSLQNLPGIVWPVSHAGAAGLLRRAALRDFAVDAGARRRYVEKFLGFDDTRSSVRVLERIEGAGGLSPAAPRTGAPPA